MTAPQCQDCGMGHRPDEPEKCIEGHGEDGDPPTSPPRNEIEYVESTSTYRCTCPPAQDEEEEIRMAWECWEREQRHAAAQQDGREG